MITRRNLLSGIMMASALTVVPSLSFARGIRIAVIGDSLSLGMGEAIKGIISGSVDNYGKVSSGLINTDFYNWFSVGERISDNGYDKVIIMIGMNDNKPIKTENKMFYPTDKEWIRLYAARLYYLANLFKKNKTEIIIVGPPSAKERSLNTCMYAINIASVYASKVCDAKYIPMLKMTSDKKGNFVDSLLIEGNPVKIRTDDGIHFTKEGYKYMAEIVSLFV